MPWGTLYYTPTMFFVIYLLREVHLDGRYYFDKDMVWVQMLPLGSKTTLNYWMMAERYIPKSQEVSNLIPRCEISSLLARKLVRWSIASYGLMLASRPSF